MAADRPDFVLASASPRRRALLGQIGLEPDAVSPTNIDETPIAGEVPRDLALRLAVQKADAAARDRVGTSSDAIVLAADTVVAVGRRILPKAETPQQARRFLELLSGRSHRVWTGIAVVRGEKHWSRRVETRVKFGRLHPDQIDAYLALDEWKGKAGAYAIQGHAALFVQSIQGSYSNVVGLPLRETAHLLEAAGLTTWRIPLR